ncbi:MAG: TonB-dependent receptor [Syntrophales bacterium]|nr:TonB-dependent receptor [Syntrophales bacterium]MDD5641587.1 TonB-dependent receptor [Syntrophales bacterium]
MAACAGEVPAPEQIEGVKKESTKEEKPDQEKPEAAIQIPQIEVLSYPEKAATSSIITKEDIGLGPLQNLPGYLEELTGVDLSRRSLLGAKNRQMTIRGFDESRYQIYLNGRTWKGSGVKGGFFVDWTSITPSDLERLEIIRGPLSAEYSNTLGGAVIINTQKGSKEPKIYFDSYWGSWETQNYRMLTTGSKGPLQYSFSTSYANTEGFLRNNYVHDRVNFNGSLTYNFPWNFSLTGSARYIAQDLGMIVYNRPDSIFYNKNDPDGDGDTLYGPGINFIGGETGGARGLTYGDRSHIYSQRYELDLEATQKFLYGEGKFHLFYFQAVREDFFYALNDPRRLIAQRGSWDEDTWGWNLKVRQNPGPVRLGFGLEGNYYGYGGISYNYLDPAYVRAPLPTSTSGLKNAQKLHGGFVDASVPFLKYFELYLGLRYDNYDAAAQPLNNVRGLRADALSPKSTLTIRPTDTTTAYVSVNYSTRFPTLPEFYWFGAGYQPVNRPPGLSPEFGMSYEAGVTQKLPWNAQVRVRTYYYDINDYIRTIFGYRPSRVVYNLDLATFRGVEVEGQVGLPYNLAAFANYTWQQTSTSPDLLNGNIRELTELPEHKANIGLKYKAPNGAEGRAYVRLVSKRYQPQVTVANNQATSAYLRPLKGFYTLNLEGRYPVGQYRGMKGFLYFGVENLTGEFYEEDAGYQMPTATFYGGVQLRY